MPLTLRQIEAFRAVVTAGSFSRAAEALGCSQPALSQIVRDLEAILDARLFDRTTRRIDLTEAGEAFARSAFAGLDVIARAVREVDDLATLRRGTVRVAAPPFLAALALPRAITALNASHPGLTLCVSDVATDAILAEVRAGQADLGLGTFPPDSGGFESVFVLSDRLMVFAHPTDEMDSLTWAALVDRPLVTLSSQSGIRLRVELGFEQAGVAFRPALEVRGIHTALGLVEEGHGRAVLPAYARAAIANRAIRAIPLEAPAVVRDVAIISARERSLSPAAALARTVIRRTMREMAARHGDAAA